MTEVSVSVLMQVDLDDEYARVTVDELRASVREAITNAVRHAEASGFIHTLAESVSIGVVEVVLNGTTEDADDDDDEQPTRTKGDDDGQEYGDPRDYRDGKE